MARNEKAPERITIRPFSQEETEVVTKAYKDSGLKKPEFWTNVIVKGCAQFKEDGGKR